MEGSRIKTALCTTDPIPAMKYHGNLGFAEQKEIRPGIWKDTITERHYSGDVIRLSRNTQNSQNVNDDMVLSNQISIVADAFLNENLFALRYISWMNAKWKISSVEVQYPRLILTIGGVWNGEPH